MDSIHTNMHLVPKELKGCVCSDQTRISSCLGPTKSANWYVVTAMSGELYTTGLNF